MHPGLVHQFEVPGGVRRLPVLVPVFWRGRARVAEWSWDRAAAAVRTLYAAAVERRTA